MCSMHFETLHAAISKYYDLRKPQENNKLAAKRSKYTEDSTLEKTIQRLKKNLNNVAMRKRKEDRVINQ